MLSLNSIIVMKDLRGAISRQHFPRSASLGSVSPIGMVLEEREFFAVDASSIYNLGPDKYQ
jgi:hypothetical protein